MRNIFAALVLVGSFGAASAADVGDCRPIKTLNEDGGYTSVLPDTCKWTVRRDINPQDDATFGSAGEGEGGGSAE